MKLSTRVMVVLGLIATITASAFGATISGTAFKRGGGIGTILAPNPGTYLSFCIAQQGDVIKRNLCYPAAFTSGTSNYTVTVPDRTTYLFAEWSSSDDYGSATTPAWATPGGSHTIAVGIGNYTLNVVMDPRPHIPMPIEPVNGEQHAAQSTRLLWTSGVDAERTSGVFTVTYDIYSTDIYGNSIRELADIPCNPDFFGHCQYVVNLYPNAPYNWSVVAKLRSDMSDPLNPYNTAVSNVSLFTTTPNAAWPVDFLAANNQNYISGCAGGILHAYSTMANDCEKFSLVDLNGNDLMSGDQVRLRNGNQYVTVPIGGGDINVTSFVPGGTETFTIVKVYGSQGSRIIHMDRVAFRTVDGYYFTAYNGGGQSMYALNQYLSAWETFAYGVTPPSP
jgi:hypothetical protein